MNWKDKLRIARALANSLDTNPNEWAFGRYTFEHRSGVAIWVCSGISFMNVEKGDFKFGGAIFAIARFIPWRVVLWRAVRPRLRELADIKAHELKAAVADIENDLASSPVRP